MRGIFQSLNTKGTSTLDKYKKFGHFKKGTTLFHEGQPAFGLYCISEGIVKQYKTNKEGRQQIVQILGSGSLMGHFALFTNGLHTTTTESISNTTTCFIDKATLLSTLAEHKNVSVDLITELAKNITEANDKLMDMAYKSVREKMASLLLSLIKHFGITHSNSIEIKIPLSREDMACLIGSSVESVVRVLSEFEKEGLITKHIRTIYLINQKELESLINH